MYIDHPGEIITTDKDRKRIDRFHLCSIEVRHGDIDHERIIFVLHTGCLSVINESQKGDDEIENSSSHLFVGMCIYTDPSSSVERERERKNANQSSSEREGGMLHLKRRERDNRSVDIAKSNPSKSHRYA